MDGHSPAAVSAPLRAERLRVAVAGRLLIDALDLALLPGEFIVTLGRNGTGKSLLLLTLAGLRAPQAGRVSLAGVDIRALPRRRIAQSIALLPQDVEPVPQLTALDSARLGRFAHRPFWSAGTARDDAIALSALAAVDATELADRPMSTLSGGEQRRIAGAGVIAQATPTVLLDEPGNHLDPQHQILLLEHFAGHCRAGGSALATLHDATLAARYATRVLLLHGDGRWQLGTADELLQPATLAQLYRTPMVEARTQSRRLFAPA